MRPIHATLLVLSLALTGPAQVALSTPASPVMPGQTVPVVLTNMSSGTYAFVSDGADLLLIRPTGEVVTPRLIPTTVLPTGTPITFHPVSGNSYTFNYQVPAPAGAPGSFLLLFRHEPRAAARLDIGTQTLFPAIHVFPTRVDRTFATHAVSFEPATPSTFDFYNVSSSPITFTASDMIEIFTPGGTISSPLVPLFGTTVPAGGRTTVPIPVASLPPGPYKARITWTDPVAGPVIREFGVRDYGRADLHLPDGHVVPFGSSIRVWLAFSSISVGMPASPAYALFLGTAPGTTPLPNGTLAPLAVNDPLVLASISGLGGLLTNHVGMATEVTGICICDPYPGAYESPDITLAHPNVLGLSGAAIRIAGIVFEPSTGEWGASQPETIFLE